MDDGSFELEYKPKSSKIDNLITSGDPRSFSTFWISMGTAVVTWGSLYSVESTEQSFFSWALKILVLIGSLSAAGVSLNGYIKSISKIDPRVNVSKNLTLTFSPSGIGLKSRTLEEKHLWEDVLRVFETKEYLLILLDSERELRISRSKLLEGNRLEPLGEWLKSGDINYRQLNK